MRFRFADTIETTPMISQAPTQSTTCYSPRMGIFLAVCVMALSACAPFPGSTATPTNAVHIPQDIISRIDASLSNLAETESFSGSVLIAQGDTVLLRKGYGMADIESGEPNSPHTRFRIYSITKEFTATAILILQAQGKLNVQDHICEYIVDCPAAWQEITIHHLLTHTSGISDQSFFERILGRQGEQFTPVELVAVFKDTPLDFEPGAEFRYSNPGYMVLGYVIEQVSGQSYEEFLQEHILSPLSLFNTGYDHLESDVATGYSSYGIEARSIDTSVPYSAGGLYSTVEDLYRWIQAFHTDQYFSRDLFAPLFTPFISAPSEDHFAQDASYGYGWVIGERNSHRLIGHTGSYYGFCGFLEYYPDEQITIVVLSNLEYWNSPSAFTLPSELIFEEE